MPSLNNFVLAIAAAYLLGSIPFGYLLVRIFRHQDIRALGSGNIGATNVARSGAKGLGILTLVLDCLKALTAVLLAHQLAPASPDLPIYAALAAILGHMFPVWLAFHGGKGVACGLGVFLALAPRATACALAVFVLTFLLTRYVSLASILASVTLPLFARLLAPRFESAHDPPWFAAALAISLLITVKHHSNIRRLLAGTENRFGGRSTQAKVAQ